MRALSRQKRRLNGPKASKSAARAYQIVLRKFLASYHESILEMILEGWDSNPRVNRGEIPHADSSAFVYNKIGTLRLNIEEKFDPGTQLSADVKTVAARVNKKAEIEFKRVIGITPRSVLAPDQTFLLDAFRDRNVNLIKSLQGDELDSITKLLGEAETGGWDSDELRSEIKKEFSVSESKADLLARDQVLKLNGQITKTQHENAGITHYIWTTSNDERVRPAHENLDGTKQAWANPPVISEDGRTGHPGDDYQCRCTAYPLLSELDEEFDEG